MFGTCTWQVFMRLLVSICNFSSFRADERLARSGEEGSYMPTAVKTITEGRIKSSQAVQYKLGCCVDQPVKLVALEMLYEQNIGLSRPQASMQTHTNAFHIYVYMYISPVRESS